MGVVEVKCPKCGSSVYLRQLGRYYFKHCGIGWNISENIIRTGISLKKLREKGEEFIDITPYLATAE